MTESFTEKVYAAVQKIPKGSVATYAQIAALAGNPNAARAVGNALHKNPDSSLTPCHRVVNSKGHLAQNFAFDGPLEQKLRLELDGVKVFKDGKNYKVDLEKYII